MKHQLHIILLIALCCFNNFIFGQGGERFLGGTGGGCGLASSSGLSSTVVSLYGNRYTGGSGSGFSFLAGNNLIMSDYSIRLGYRYLGGNGSGNALLATSVSGSFYTLWNPRYYGGSSGGFSQTYLADMPLSTVAMATLARYYGGNGGGQALNFATAQSSVATTNPIFAGGSASGFNQVTGLNLVMSDYSLRLAMRYNGGVGSGTAELASSVSKDFYTLWNPRYYGGSSGGFSQTYLADMGLSNTSIASLIRFYGGNGGGQSLNLTTAQSSVATVNPIFAGGSASGFNLVTGLNLVMSDYATKLAMRYNGGIGSGTAELANSVQKDFYTLWNPRFYGGVSGGFSQTYLADMSLSDLALASLIRFYGGNGGGQSLNLTTAQSSVAAVNPIYAGGSASGFNQVTGLNLIMSDYATKLAMRYNGGVGSGTAELASSVQKDFYTLWAPRYYGGVSGGFSQIYLADMSLSDLAFASLIRFYGGNGGGQSLNLATAQSSVAAVNPIFAGGSASGFNQVTGLNLIMSDNATKLAMRYNGGVGSGTAELASSVQKDFYTLWTPRYYGGVSGGFSQTYLADMSLSNLALASLIRFYGGNGGGQTYNLASAQSSVASANPIYRGGLGSGFNYGTLNNVFIRLFNIIYDPIANSTSKTGVALNNVVINNSTGLNTLSGTKPRCYYKKKTDSNDAAGWKYVEATGSASPFSFSLDYSKLNGGKVVAGDTIQYFVIAQDNASTPNIAIANGTASGSPVSVNLYSSGFPINGTINNYWVSPGTFVVTFTAPTHGTLLVKNGTATVSSGDLIYDGTTLAVTATPSLGYVQDTLQANHVDIVSNSFKLTEPTNVVATFTIPTWTGATSTDWNTATNWKPNVVPTNTINAIIPTTATNMPLAADNSLVHDLTINNGAVVTIPAAKSLTVAGSITNNAGVSGLVVKSSSDLANGTLVFNNAQNAPVPATVEMYSKASWNQTNSSGDKYKWQYIGSPVRSLLASPTFDAAILRRYEESQPTSNWIAETSTSILSPFKGYEIAQEAAKTYTITGELVNADLSQTLLKTSGVVNPGNHVLSNPYTAAVDITKLNFGAQTEATVYLYNTGSVNEWASHVGVTNGSNPGQYTSAPASVAGEGGIPAQIPSMQGFVVKAMSNDPAATFGMPYSSVATKNVEMQRVRLSSRTTSKDYVYSIIDVEGAHGGDRMWLFTNQSCTHEFDNSWDGRKMFGSALVPQLFAKESDGNYQVDAVNDVNNTELGFQAGTDTEYTLRFTHTNVQSVYGKLYLLDYVTGKITDITSSGTEYSFVAQSTSSPTTRFKIVTSSSVQTDVNSVDSKPEIKVYSSGKTIFVQNMSNDRGDLMLYDVAGRFISKHPFGAKSITTIPVNLAQGVYVVKAVVNNQKVVTTNVIIP